MVASGAIKVPMPIILGHEGVGEVQEVGPVTTTTLVKGDVVMMSFASCGQCHSCVDGHPAYCGDGKPRNWSGARPDGSFNTFFPASAGEDGALDVMSARPVAASFFGQSSFAKMAVVDVRSCVKVPPALLQSSSGSSIPFSHIAPFGCGFGTGAGTVLNVCKPPAGSSIAVYGVGAVGLAAIAAAAHLTPATTIIAVDILAGKLEVARRLGATVCIDSSQGPPVEAAAAVMGATGGRGLNFAIDTTGNAGVIKSMLEALGPNGMCCCIDRCYGACRRMWLTSARIGNPVGRVLARCHCAAQSTIYAKQRNRIQRRDIGRQ